MSSHKLPINLSAAAELDFADILQYTETTWGQMQANAYATILSDAFDLISRNPRVGRKKDAWFKGCFVYHVARHLILYIVADTKIVIVRILHDRTDMNRLF